MSARDRQVGGTHYTNMVVQPWDAIKSARGLTAFVEYLVGGAIAYLMRAGHKGSLLEDLKKASHVIDEAIETLEKETGVVRVEHPWSYPKFSQMAGGSVSRVFTDVCGSCGHSQDRHRLIDDVGENQCSCGCSEFTNVGCKPSEK